MDKEHQEISALTISDLRQLAKIGGVGNPKKAERLLKHALHTKNPRIIAAIRRYFIRESEAAVTNLSIFARPQQELIMGKMRFGLTEDGYIVGLDPEYINKHCVIAGPPDSGKSTLIEKLFCDLVDMGISVWFISISKREPRRLLSIRPKIKVIRLGSSGFRTNPWKHEEKFLPQHGDGILTNLFSEYFGLMSGAEIYMLSSVSSLREIYRNQHVSQSISFFDFRDYLEDLECTLDRYSAERRYCERIKSRVTGLLQATGNLFDCSDGCHLEDLENETVIWEVDSLPSDVQNFIIGGVILPRPYFHRLVSPEKHKLLVIIIEEAHRFFDIRRWLRNSSSTPSVGIMLDTMRGLDMGLIASCQSPSATMPNILSSCNLKIMFRLGDWNDVQIFGRCMGMNPEQLAGAIQLQPRTVIITTSKVPQPFIVHIDNIDIKTSEVTDQQIETRMKEFYSNITIVPRISYKDIMKEKVSEIEEKFLLHIANNRLSPIVVRYAAINVPVDRGNRMKKRLLRMGMIRQIELALGKKGGVVKLLSLTEIGRDYLKQKGFNISHEGKGGIEHYFYQSKVKSFFERKGHLAEIEGSVNGHCVDVLVKSPDGNLLAVEVAATTRDWESVNLQKDLSAGFSKIVFACKNKEVQETLMKKFAPDGKLNPRVALTLVKDYL